MVDEPRAEGKEQRIQGLWWERVLKGWRTAGGRVAGGAWAEGVRPQKVSSWGLGRELGRQITQGPHSTLKIQTPSLRPTGPPGSGLCQASQYQLPLSSALGAWPPSRSCTLSSCQLLNLLMGSFLSLSPHPSLKPGIIIVKESSLSLLLHDPCQKLPVSILHWYKVSHRYYEGESVLLDLGYECWIEGIMASFYISLWLNLQIWPKGEKQYRITTNDILQPLVGTVRCSNISLPCWL